MYPQLHPVYQQTYDTHSYIQFTNKHMLYIQRHSWVPSGTGCFPTDIACMRLFTSGVDKWKGNWNRNWGSHLCPKKWRFFTDLGQGVSDKMLAFSIKNIQLLSLFHNFFGCCIYIVLPKYYLEGCFFTRKTPLITLVSLAQRKGVPLIKKIN